MVRTPLACCEWPAKSTPEACVPLLSAQKLHEPFAWKKPTCQGYQIDEICIEDLPFFPAGIAVTVSDFVFN